MPDILLWLSDSRGQYIPRDFACSFANRAECVFNVSVTDWKTLEAGPHDNEWYWEAWNNVCDCARIVIGSTVYTVYQDGDCWLVPVGMEWSDEQDCFVWPNKDEN
jgi:hypothetical protein